MVVERIKIGPWTVTPTLNQLELEHGQQSIKIEPRAMDVLVFLARRNGAVVSVEELIATVWKGVIVGDGSVYLAIRQLRQALGDSADGTRYIETVSKRGYRLTVSAETNVPEAAPEPAAAQSPTRGRRHRLIHRWLAAAVVAVAIAGGLVFALRDRAPPVLRIPSPFCRSRICLPIPSRRTSPME